MTLASKHGSPTSTLEKPLREALQRWRIRLVTGLCVTFLALVSIPRTLAVGDGVGEAFASPYRNPWIPKDFLSNYRFNAESCGGIRAMVSSCHTGNTTSSVHTDDQCLSLEGEKARSSVCDLRPGPPRERRLNRFHLRFCHRYTVASVLSPDALNDVLYTAKCPKVLQDLEALDAAAQRLQCEFEDLLSRYNCQSGFSVKWTCQHCTRAYQDWVCAMVMPFYVPPNPVQVKPCRTFCHRVEKRCPYFHPASKEQYAGEPVFICIDPNIPDIPSITPNSAYGQPDSCYRLCHLDPQEVEDDKIQDISTMCNISHLSVTSSVSSRTTTVPSVTHTPSMTWTQMTPHATLLSGNTSSIRMDLSPSMDKEGNSTSVASDAPQRHLDQNCLFLCLIVFYGLLLQTFVPWTLWRTRGDFLASHENTSS